MFSTAKNFFVPHSFNFQRKSDFPYRVAIIVPTFKPSELTIHLVTDLLRWNDGLLICVVDDSTPEPYESEHRIFERLRTLSNRIIILRTSTNRLKAGAINEALVQIFNMRPNVIPDAIITLDDDVVIERDTVQNLVNNLFEDDSLGAVCSQCRVLNKNCNILTRLQGLEYLGYNALRLADEGFFSGPLVMHGMLTAFRTSAIKSVGLFAEGHLIEDYEITSRLKSKGWHTRLAVNARAWTSVPETFVGLWFQRARWVYGGITVVTESKSKRSVVQDIIGHSLFLSTLALIILSFLFVNNEGSISSAILLTIIMLSIVQVGIWYSFQLWFMRFYAEKDWKDWVLRATLLPEFLYGNALTVVLFGAYAFHAFQVTFSRVKNNEVPGWKLKSMIGNGFAEFGFTQGWGTR